MIEPTATPVATDEPGIAANSAHASTPARPMPPYQWPMSEVVKRIIRLATPPWVRKLPARMKNGIAMISNRDGGVPAAHAGATRTLRRQMHEVARAEAA